MGSSSKALQDAEMMLASSSAFRTRVGANSLEEAKGFIGYGETNQQCFTSSGETLDRPAVVLGVEGFAYNRMMIGGQPIAVARGHLCLILTDRVTNPQDHKASYLAFWEWVSDLIDEMATTDRSGSDFFSFNFELVIPPWRPSPGERKSDDFFECVFLLHHETARDA